MAAKRETIEPKSGSTRYVRRDANGRFTSDQVDKGKSISQDMKRDAKKTSEPGQGDKGDRNAGKKKA